MGAAYREGPFYLTVPAYGTAALADEGIQLVGSRLLDFDRQGILRGAGVDTLDWQNGGRFEYVARSGPGMVYAWSNAGLFAGLSVNGQVRWTHQAVQGSLASPPIIAATGSLTYLEALPLANDPDGDLWAIAMRRLLPDGRVVLRRELDIARRIGLLEWRPNTLHLRAILGSDDLILTANIGTRAPVVARLLSDFEDYDVGDRRPRKS